MVGDRDGITHLLEAALVGVAYEVDEVLHDCQSGSIVQERG